MTQPLRRSGMLVSKILRGCEGKRRYSDEYGARGLGQIQQERTGIALYIYPCTLCGGWHLTKHPQADKTRAVSYEFEPTPR